MSTTMVASEVKAVPAVISSIQDIPLEKKIGNPKQNHEPSLTSRS